MRVDDFDFELPEERIALEPASPRDSARLLQVAGDGALSDHLVRDLPDILRPGDLLVINETKVIPAQLLTTRWRGADSLPMAVTLVEKLPGDDARWLAFARPGKRLKLGDIIALPEGAPADQAPLTGTVIAKLDDGRVTIRFDGTDEDVAAALHTFGLPPLPPYIAGKRGYRDADEADYQTVYAKTDGSVAAPTAGLHFTPDLIERLEMAGVAFAKVTLHVGIGTFLPVKVESVRDHVMHAEWGEIPTRWWTRTCGCGAWQGCG